MTGDVQTTTQRLLDDLVDSGAERGLQVAAYHHGELVVDAWAGIADPSAGTPVGHDTLFTVYSVSKGITATAVHILAERGTLTYDDPIARHWPEFAQQGKAGILIRHALTHTAGLPQMPPRFDTYDVTDWPRMCDRIAGLPPLFPAGETPVYHALTYGWIVGGVTERADGRPFGRIVAEEIAAPLALDGLYFGVPASEASRVATLVEPPGLVDAAGQPSPPIPGIVPDEAATAVTMNRSAMRRACLPAYGLTANARSLAKAYAALIGEGVDGVRLFSEERRRIATTIHVDGIDPSSDLPITFALGYGVGGPESVMGPRRSAFGHGGYGGALGFADPNYGLAIGVTKNHLTWDAPKEGATWRLTHHIRKALNIPDTSG